MQTINAIKKDLSFVRQCLVPSATHKNTDELKKCSLIVETSRIKRQNLAIVPQGERQRVLVERQQDQNWEPVQKGKIVSR